MARSQVRRRYNGPLQAVIFDWAGTIVDFGSRAPVRAMTNVFSDLHVPITVAEARGSMGMAKRDHIRAVLEIPRVHDRWRVVHDQAPDESAVDEVYRTFLAAQREVLLELSAPISGACEAVDHCRRQGLKIGSSTGYTAELMEPLVAAAASSGLRIDALVCADDVPRGRPAPWMCLENARRLDVYPMEGVVAVDDTCVGIEAGLNAGMWTVGVAKSGNLVGLSEVELASLADAERELRIAAAHKQLHGSGAHFVVETVAELPEVLKTIGEQLKSGLTP